MIGAPQPELPGAGAAAAPPPPDAASRLVAARLVALAPGFYAFHLTAAAPWHVPAIGLALPAIQVAAAPERDDAIEITDSDGRCGGWLGGRRQTLFVKAPAGGAALLTAYLAHDPAAASPVVEIRRIGPADDWGAAAVDSDAGRRLAPWMTLRLDDRPSATAAAARPASLDVIAHIRGRGDVRFVDSPWIGRLGPGMWIEAFTILTGEEAVAASLEYKGLTADGDETPWLGCGALCGTRGRGLPLIGFALRQRAGADAVRLDCEYTGYFQSGAVAGPARNGAPCRSHRDNDPLDGMRLSITARAPRPAAEAAAR